MDELNKQNVGEESAAAQPGGESAQPVPPADTGAQQTQQTAEPAGESAPAPETQLGKLICPRCGNAFEPKEKKCPHCGMKNNLKLCKTCGATIAKSAKHCPKCGAKNKKPIYKRVWFWILMVIASLIAISSFSTDSNFANSPENAIVGTWEAKIYYDLNEKKFVSIDEIGMDWQLKFNSNHTGTTSSLSSETTSFEWSYSLESADGDKIYKVKDGSGEFDFAIIGKHDDLNGFEGDLLLTRGDGIIIFKRTDSKTLASTSTQATKPTSSVQKSETSLTMTSSQKNAVKKAESYLKYSAFSYTGLIEQLEYEGYSNDDATYAALNCGADWKEQAAKKAEEYLKYSAFSKSGLIEQLEYEGFTHEQAVYGADQAY